MRHREAARRRLAAIGLPPGPVAVTPAQAAQLARARILAAICAIPCRDRDMRAVVREVLAVVRAVR